MIRYGATILLGAFLLFQVQPLIAKLILPWFGGGPAVWSTCMLFFQVTLVGGYVYAHLLHTWLRPRTQAWVHGVLLGSAMWFLPIIPDACLRPEGTENPSLHILRLLTVTVGMPYLLLAATGPLMQAWFARAHAGRSPYRLYSLSNLGSLVALISFPFVFEPVMSSGAQAAVWSWAFGGFAVLSVACALGAIRAHRSREIAKPEPTSTRGSSRENTAIESSYAESSCGGVAVAVAPRVSTSARAVTETVEQQNDNASAAAPSLRTKCTWIALASIPSIMLLATTNMMCQDIAVVPFFWVFPLAIYLLTFIVTFHSETTYRRSLDACLLAGAAVAVFLCVTSRSFGRVLEVQAIVYGACLFLCGLVCHGELVLRKPSPRHLTSFYLCISSGGAIGGVFVALIAPLLFATYLELEIGLSASLLVASLVAWRAGPRIRWVVPAVSAAGVLVAIVLSIDTDTTVLDQRRNFFGRLRVEANPAVLRHDGKLVRTRALTLSHGRTLHGIEMEFKGRQRLGMTYYGAQSGVGYALASLAKDSRRGLRVGVVGLGAGTLSTYARRRDEYTFYEIDPDVVEVAEKHFSYLRSARTRGATVSLVVGDARVQLEREFETAGSRRYDVLVVDAFSSDAIPVHLLTRECNRIYWQHLEPDGLLVIHVSNTHLDLNPVVRGLAGDAHKKVRFIKTKGDNRLLTHRANWAIVTGNGEFLARRLMRVAGRIEDESPRSVLWTDDFSSIWNVLIW